MARREDHYGKLRRATSESEYVDPVETYEPWPGKVAASRALRRPVMPEADAGAAPESGDLLSRAPGSSGSGPPGDVRGRHDSSLGAGLGAVSVHTGSASATAAPSVGALVAKDMRFAAGEHLPNGSRSDDLHQMRHAIGALHGGSTLPDTAQAHFGRLLEADLSGVRIHAGGAASSAATDLGARAYTHGSHIAFAPGGYDPSNATDNPVLAHELVHVVQNQRAGGEAMQFAARMDVGPSGSAVETEAESGASALMSGQSFSVSARSSLPGISLFGPNDPPPANTGAPPANTGAPPANTGAPPANTGAPPANTGAPPANTGAPPANTGAPPANTGAPPANTGAPPANTGAPPANTGAPPANTGAPPANTGAPGATPGANAPPAPSTTPAPVGGESGKIDARVAEILEQRKDPTAAAQYAQTMGSVDSLRLQALQYGFTKSTIGHTLLQMVWPSDAVGDHVGQIYKLNAYRGVDGGGMDSFLGGLQKGIEGLRGVLHLVGDILAAISGIAGTVAIAAAAVAAVAAISIIGNAGVSEVAAGIAAIADQISVVTAAAKIACDIIDMILGILQMVILCIRARMAKGDPAARARFAQLMHKEAGDFASNVTGVALQIGALVITAGAGASAGKGIAKMTFKDFAGEFEKLWKPSVMYKETLETFESSTKLISKGVADIPKGGSILESGNLKLKALGSDADLATLSVVKRSGRGVTARGANGKPIRKIVEFDLARAGKNGVLTVINTSKLARFAIVDGSAQIAAAGGAQMVVELKAPSASGTAPAGNQVQAPQMGKVGGSLSTVQMWPSQIDKFTTAKGLLPAVKERMEEQYNNAKDQAGPELGAAFETKLKAAIEKRNAAKEQAGAVKGDADESKQHGDEAATNANKGAGQKAQADAKTADAKDKGQATMDKSESLKSPPPKDGVGSWIYNHSVGYLAQAIGWVQSGIKNNIGKLLFYIAGYDKNELDFAGIENDMRTSSQKDTTAGTDAQAAGTAVDPVQAAVVEMQKDKTTTEQQAIQGMADSKNFLESLEEADKALAEAIEAGNAYMNAAGAVISSQLDTETQQKTIDDAYLQPVLSYADAIGKAVVDEDEGPNISSQANAVLAKMQAAVPGLDIGPGQAQISKDAAAYATGHAQIVASTQAAVSQAKTTLASFKGTNDYDGVNANSMALDKLADETITAMDALGQKMCDDINAMLTQYNDAIAKAAADQQPDPQQQGTPPANAGAGTPPANANGTGAPPANGGTGTPPQDGGTGAPPKDAGTGAPPGGTGTPPNDPNATPPPN